MDGLRDHMMGRLAHGIDAVQVARIARLADEEGAPFLDRCFTAGERAYCDGSGALRTQRYATRFAAKEAAMKALGTGWTNGVGFQDVEVVSTGIGAPELRLHGKFSELARERGMTDWTVSLSHTADLAFASVVALCSASD